MPDNPLPTINALLNLTALAFLILGRISVKRGDITGHWRMMSLALGSSALFLASYLYYHYVLGSQVEYRGFGPLRVIYFTILIPHVILAAVQVPFILLTVWTAVAKRFSQHVRLVRWVWPVWVFVSVTGVMVYLMLYVIPHG